MCEPRTVAERSRASGLGPSPLVRAFPAPHARPRHAVHLHLEELEAVDPPARRGRLPGGPRGGRAALRLGAAETGGRYSHQGMVHRWNLLDLDDPCITLGHPAALGTLHTA